jgi:peptidyl-prolyl cis-trans isomerase C
LRYARPQNSFQRLEAQQATIKGRMKFFEVALIFAFSGLVAMAQQPSSSASGAKEPEAAAAPKADVAADAVVLTIGTQKITRAQFEAVLAALAENGHAATTPAARRQVAEQYGALEAMAQAARSRKLDQEPEVKTMLTIQMDNFLAQMLAKKLSEEAQITDLDLRAYYNAHQKEFEEAKGSHILIRFKGSAVPLKPNEKDLTDAEALAKAKELRAKIVAGADFATLAKAESDDTGSAAKGGDLGTFRHGQMVAAFDEAAFSMPVGQVSEPIKTQFGYHLIKISSRSAKTFDEAKPEIEKQMKPQMAREAVEKVRAQTPVTLNDEFFGK